MYENDVWSGLADFLANMIEKYAGEMDLDALPDPRQQSRLKGIEEVYRRYMRLSAEARQAAQSGRFCGCFHGVGLLFY